MKITNPSTVVADTAVTITYVVESGDPPSFFFEIFVEENGDRQAVSSGQLFSSSGSFQTTPGYTGGHYIEVYEPSAAVGVTKPFTTGPTYDVLEPGSTPTTAPPASPTTATTVNSPPTVQAPTTTNTAVGGGSTQTSLRSTQIGDSGSVVDDATSLLASETQTPTTAVTVTRSREGSGLSVIEIVAASGTVAVPTQQTGSVTSLSSPTTVSAASEPPARAHTNAGVIVGAVVGALVLLALLLLVGRRFRRRQPEDIQFEPAFMVSSRHPTVAPFLGFAVPSSASGNNEKRATATLSAAALARLGFLRLPDSLSAPAAADPTTLTTVVDNAKRLGHTTSRSRASTLSETSTLASRTGESSVAFTPMPIENSTHAAYARSTLPSPAAPNTSMQMEWVLRPTTDPPPGYSDTQAS
ncbi:hypothetical protein HMN09_00386200 [Mycena chlorophos]|uniref:Uncharacterized protein n=1 Tax=Mycena chlorophos TaxID=658473 RepID=A0A8H6TKD4_MYCCL|nr:hypothetical protein HMN09_00386200 [Mycena chlorophos]